MLGVHRFGAATLGPLSNRGRVVPTNTLGSARRGASSRALDCRPDAAGAVHCVSPGAFETVEVARDGAPIEPEPAAAHERAKSEASNRRPIARSDDDDDANPRELLRRDELLRGLACVPDAATGALRCNTPGAFPAVAVAPDGGPIKPPRKATTKDKAQQSRRSRATGTERLGAARDEKKSAHPAPHAHPSSKASSAARASCRPGVDGSMRCTTPGAFPAVNPDALDVPAKPSDDSTASTGKARRDDASSDSVEKKASSSSEKKASSSSEKEASKKKLDAANDDENADETTEADVPPEEESDPDAQMLEETDAVTVDVMAGERRERHPAAYQVVDASYEARRAKEREDAAKEEREAMNEATVPGEDASALAESEIKSWEKSATTEITPDRMAQFKEMEMEGAEEPMDGEVDETPKRLHEPKLFCAPDGNGKMKCAHSLVAASQ